MRHNGFIYFRDGLTTPQHRSVGAAGEWQGRYATEALTMSPDQQQQEAFVARFSENHLGRKQVVDLFRDRVEVSGSRVLSSEYEWRAPLISLSPTLQRGRVRHPLFVRGLMLLVGWFVVFVILLDIPGVHLQSGAWGLFFSLPVFFLVLALLDPKKRRYATVCSVHGAPLFHVVANPPDGDHFDSFLSTLEAAIRAAAEPDTPRPHSNTTVGRD